MTQAPAANVLEFRVLWTHHKTQKLKSWQDGFLKLHSFNKRAMLYDDSRTLVDSLFMKSLDVEAGQSIIFDRALCSVEEFLSSVSRDVGPVIRSKVLPAGVASQRRGSTFAMGTRRVGLSKRVKTTGKAIAPVSTTLSSMPHGSLSAAATSVTVPPEGNARISPRRRSNLPKKQAKQTAHMQVLASKQLVENKMGSGNLTGQQRESRDTSNADPKVQSTDEHVQRQHVEIEISVTPKRKRSLLCVGRTPTTKANKVKRPAAEPVRMRMPSDPEVKDSHKELGPAELDVEISDQEVLMENAELTLPFSNLVDLNPSERAKTQVAVDDLPKFMSEGLSTQISPSLDKLQNLETCKIANPLATSDKENKADSDEPGISAWSEEEAFDLFSWRPAG